MDKLMSDPIEQRIKTLELKVEFLENWKNTPFIQVTLPVILSIFLATSWGNFAIVSLDRRIDSVDKRIDSVDKRINSVDKRINSVDKRINSVDKRLGKLEGKMDKLLSEFQSFRTGLNR